jgi:acyl-CoA synthetase (AMP-forming)/AMP-acid ligase II
MISQLSLIDVLTPHATERPDMPAYTFLEDGVAETHSITYASLDKEVRGIASGVSEHAEPGTRALLIYPPGIDFISVFLGCLHAGIIAVPVHTPRSGHYWDRLRSIIEDSHPDLRLTTSQFGSRIQSSLISQTGTGIALGFLRTSCHPPDRRVC